VKRTVRGGCSESRHAITPPGADRAINVVSWPSSTPPQSVMSIAIVIGPWFTKKSRWSATVVPSQRRPKKSLL